MGVTLGFSGNTPAAGDGGGGGGVPSGGSTTARSILTVSQEDNKNTTAMVMCTEVTSSSYPILDENLDHLELGLGLSIGGGGGGGGLKSKTVVAAAAPAVAMAGPCWSQYARILTAKDFLVSKPNNSCSSSSSVGTKRTATDSVSPPNGVVGWPPVSKAHRMPSLANQTKSPSEELVSIAEQIKNKNQTNGGKDYCNERKGISVKKYRSVKVNMDGTLIGRKVDLNAFNSYETLAQTLEEMFWGRRCSGENTKKRELKNTLGALHLDGSSAEATGSSRLLDGTSEFVLTYQDKDGDCMLVGDVPWRLFRGKHQKKRTEEHPGSTPSGRYAQMHTGSSAEATGSSRLLDGTSEFVLTYQDKDGDCMLVGDVPWRMFLSSVKRLRIMRNSESNELSRKQRSKLN